MIKALSIILSSGHQHSILFIRFHYSMESFHGMADRIQRILAEKSLIINDLIKNNLK